jgi:hypothetical protein
VTAAAYTALALVLAGCAAYAARDRISAAILRARWAWHCHGNPPVPRDGEKLTREEAQALGNLAAGRDVRSRT